MGAAAFAPPARSVDPLPRLRVAALRRAEERVGRRQDAAQALRGAERAAVDPPALHVVDANLAGVRQVEHLRVAGVHQRPRHRRALEDGEAPLPLHPREQGSDSPGVGNPEIFLSRWGLPMVRRPERLKGSISTTSRKHRESRKVSTIIPGMGMDQGIPSPAREAVLHRPGGGADVHLRRQVPPVLPAPRRAPPGAGGEEAGGGGADAEGVPALREEDEQGPVGVGVQLPLLLRHA
eukprot:gene123-biopygen1755